jgi:hypothetical protein
MRHLLLALALLTASISQAQFYTTSVATFPDPPTECDPFDLIVDGQIGCINWMADGITASVSGSTITVDVTYLEPFICLPAIGLVTNNTSVGPIPAGTYTVVVQFGTDVSGILETFTTTITVDACASPCDDAPMNLMSMINTNGSATLSWDPVPSSVACRVQGRPLGGSFASTSPVFGTEPTSFTVPASFLSSGTTYEWEAQCACSITPLEATPWSATASFTMPSPRLASELSLINVSARSIRIDGLNAAEQYEVYDLTGRMVASGQTDAYIDLQGMHSGWYTVRIGGSSHPLVLTD